MSISSYYGGSQWKTFLDYGEMSENGLRRTIQRQYFDQDAYDHHHLALYMKDFLKCRQSSKRQVVDFSDIPRKDKNLLTYKMLEEFTDILEITELGSTIFEVIDGLEVCKRYEESKGNRFEKTLHDINLTEIIFSGIEISELFRELALVLHAGYNIKQFKSVEDFLATENQIPRLLIDRSVANYVFNSGKEFGQFAKNFKYGLINTYFSLEKDFFVTRYGKQMNYLSLSDFLGEYSGKVFHLYGFEAPRPIDGFKLSGTHKVIEGFFLMARESEARRYVDRLFADPLLRQFLETKSFKLRPAEEFII